MTLFTFSNSEGSRRCDAKCYDADHPNCDCICAGMNHGKGKESGMKNANAYGNALLEKMKETQPETYARIKEFQLELFK